MMIEAVLIEDDINIKLDQACDTEPSGDLFSGDGTMLSLQSNAKSSYGYHSSISTDISGTVQPDKSMCVYGTAVASCAHDLVETC